MSDLGELDSDIEESNSEEDFIKKLTNEIQEQQRLVSENLIKYIQDIDKLTEEKRSLESESREFEDNIKTVELLLKTRSQELAEQQNKYDKLLAEKKIKQDQFDEILLKLNGLMETKKVYTEDMSIISSILPQLEKEEENRKNNLQNLLEKQKDTEAQISKFFTETRSLYTKLEMDKESTLGEERKLIEYWFALENTFRKLEEQVDPFLEKPLPQPPKSLTK